MGLIVSSLGIFIANKTGGNLLNLTAEDTTYTLTLNSSNSVSSAGDYVQHTAQGGEVTFTYASVSTPTGNNHTTILNGGSIVNKDVIHSISKFNAVFEGQLQARISYLSNKNWGGYFDLVSGQTIDLGSHPYYLELKATSNVILESATYTYTCKVNPDAEEQDTEGSYDITFKQNGDSYEEPSASLTTANVGGEVTSGSSYISSYTAVTSVFSGKSGIKIGSKSNSGTLTFSVSFSETITTIDFTTVRYGTDSSTFNIYINGSSTSAGSFSAASGGSITVNDNVTSISISTNKRSYLQGITFNYGGKTEPGTPEPVEVGFEASDANRMDYTTNNVFATENALSVKSINSNGQKTSLTTGYTYKIYNSLDAVIDANVKFPSAGTYRLVVSYKNYIPQEIELVVGVYVYPTDIVASMNVVNFTTADAMSDNLNDNLSILVNFSDGTSNNISYANFGENYTVSLLSPKGISHNINTVFGTEGKWSLKVSSVLNEELDDSVSLNVAAIPVQSVSLNNAQLDLEVGDTAKLKATITPNNATNQLCNWTSNNEDVATVDETGLVTAVGVGQATITATSLDGTNKYGSCLVKVTEKVLPDDEGAFEKISGSDLEVGQYVIFTGYKSGSYYAMAGQNSNNRAAVTVTISNNKIFRTSESTFKAFEVKAGTSANTFAFYDADEGGYLYAASSGSNYLRTEASLTANSSFSTSLVAQGSNTRDHLKFNGSNNPPIFSCYASTSTQSDVEMYAKGGSGSTPTPTPSTVYPTSIDVTGTSSIAVGATSQLSVEYTPSNTTIKNVTYSSNNTSVATVSSSGLVTGVSAGSARITASAAAENGYVTDTIDITVSNIAVTGVSLDPTSISIKAGKTATLVASVTPANAYNKDVSFTSSNTSVATVTNAGVVTGVAAGNSTITVTTADGGHTATCAVTVTPGSSASGSFTINTSDVPAQYSGSSFTASDFSFASSNIGNSYTSGVIQWKNGVGYMYNKDAINGLNDISIESATGKTFSLTITSGSSSNPSGNSATLNNTNNTYSFPANVSYFKLTANSGGAQYTGDITISYSTEPINPTSISISPSPIEATPGQSKDLSVKYTPSNANQNKEVTWASSNTNVATIDSNGKVSVKSTATAGQSTTITATLSNLTSVYTSTTLTVVESSKAAWTIMIYMCGSDLESGTDSNGNIPSARNATGLASSDLDEILQVSGQPDDVNIIIETGGANIWQSGHSYSISSSNLERWHIANKKMVKDDSLTYAGMGKSSTFQSFLEWGLEEYPAEKTGVIMWNHGGGMHGVCYDEKDGDDSLLNSEVKTAVKNAFTNTGRNTSDKLEWIGYDACLMSVQDIAEFNSTYFNYQVSSEESESGYGWDYDNWVDDLYAKKQTESVLKAIVDSFISSMGGANSNQDQTLSYLDLAYALAYKTAWEAMASQLNSVVTTSNKSSFNNAIKNYIKHYADDDYDYFCLFDAKDFVEKLVSDSAFSSFRIGSTYTDNVLSAHNNFVAYSVAQKGAGKSYGVCMYWPNSSQYSYISTYYTTTQTNFTTWQSFCNSKGTHR